MPRWYILSFLFLLIASESSAQWLGEYGPCGFDRPGPHRVQAMRPLSTPVPRIPNWPFLNIDVTNSYVAQTEPSIAIDPLDSNTIVIGANDDSDFTKLGVYSSTDGGLTWLRQLLPPQPEFEFQYATDPSIAFSASGTAFYVNGSSDSPFNPNFNVVGCYRSTDRGENWGVLPDIFADTSNYLAEDTVSDKFYMTVDQNPGSPYKNRLYVVWVDQGKDYYGVRDTATSIVCAYSMDSGHTWSKRHHLTGLGYYTAPVPAVGPDGTLIVTFVDYTIGKDTIFIARSTDGGVSFAAPQAIANYIDLGPVTPHNGEGYPVLGIDSLMMVNSFPSIAIDRSVSHAGRAYVTWCGKGSDNQPHVWLSTSDNDGVNWSNPTPIDNDTSNAPASKFFSWIAVDPSTGNVGIDYYVARYDTARSNERIYLQADLFLAHSMDGGTTFQSRRISNRSFDPITGQEYREPGDIPLWFFGDYIGLAAVSNTWYPAWTDSRSGDDEIYTAIVQPLAPMPVTKIAAHDTIADGKTGTVLTWEYTPETTFGYSLPVGYEFSVGKDNSPIAMVPGNQLTYLDTTIEGHTYSVTVISGNYRSVADTVQIGNAGVSQNAIANGLTVRFANQPAFASRENEAHIQSDRTGHVTLTFYDELGRTIGQPLTDGVLSNEHELRFTPGEQGVRFFTLKEYSSDGEREIAGKIAVIAK